MRTVSRIICALPLFTITVTLAALAFAGVPQTINYQGYLKNTNGTPVSITTTVRFSLYSSNPARNNPVWQETRSVTPANGIYSVQLGSTTPISAPFDVPYRLGVKVGSDAEMALQPLTATPYSFMSGNVSDDSITTTKLADGAVTDIKITGPISGSKLGQHSHQTIDLPGTVVFSDTNQTISGRKSFSSTIASTVDGVAPITVKSPIQVPNLNASMIGGLTLSQLDSRYASSIIQAPPVQVPRTTTITSVDSTIEEDVGRFTSITIGSDGLPVISYYDATNGDLKVAKCSNPACSGSTNTAVDKGGDVGQYSSITIGTDGLPVISCSDITNSDLKVAKCANAACSSGTTITIVATNGGLYNSIAIGTDGLPVISYNNGGLRMAHCGNVTCTSGNTLVGIEGGGETEGKFNSIAIGTDGLPIISYTIRFDFDTFTQKVVHCGNATCSSGNTTITLDSGAFKGQHTSIAIGTDGLPVISYYYAGLLKLAHCSNATCSARNTAIVDSTGDVGLHTSITIGTDGLPVISYYDATNGDLKAAHCGNAACTSGNITVTLDSTGDVGQYTSITIGPDGLPVISYYDATNGDLKVAKCANQLCANNWSRR